MIILIRSILSADSQGSQGQGNLLIQSRPGPFPNYQHHLGFLSYNCELAWIRSSSDEKLGLSCHPASYPLPAGQQAEWHVFLWVPRLLAGWEAELGLSWGHQASSGSGKSWRPSLVWPEQPPSQCQNSKLISYSEPDRMNNCPSSLQTKVFPGLPTLE